MRCLRNKIHANLFLTYMLANSCWILTALMQDAHFNHHSVRGDAHKKSFFWWSNHYGLGTSPPPSLDLSGSFFSRNFFPLLSG